MVWWKRAEIGGAPAPLHNQLPLYLPFFFHFTQLNDDWDESGQTKKTKTSAKTNTNKQTIGKTPIVHMTQPITY